MKNVIVLGYFVLMSLLISAQAPVLVGFQAVVRDVSGALIKNTVVSVRISILFQSVQGAPLYIESHNPTTNINGLFTINIGSGSSDVGDFGSIDWSSGLYFLKTEIDLAGGTSYKISGVSQLISVPYALYANQAPSIIPLYTQTDVNKLQNPKQGLQVYNTTTNKLIIYVGDTWRELNTTFCDACGNGVLSDCEECDDGNNVSQDVCNFICKVEDFMEPNNSFDQAVNLILAGSDKITTTFIGTDIDFFKFSLAAGKTITFTENGNLVMMLLYDSNKNIVIGSAQGTISVKNFSSTSSIYYLSLNPVNTAKPFVLKIPYLVTP